MTATLPDSVLISTAFAKGFKDYPETGFCIYSYSK